MSNSSIELVKAYLRLVENDVIPNDKIKVKACEESAYLQLLFCQDGIDMNINVANDRKKGIAVKTLCWGDAELSFQCMKIIENRVREFFKTKNYESRNIEFCTFLEEYPNTYSYSTYVELHAEESPDWETILQISIDMGRFARQVIKELDPGLDNKGLVSKRAPFSYMLLNWDAVDESQDADLYVGSINNIDTFVLDDEDPFKANENDIPFSV